MSCEDDNVPVPQVQARKIAGSEARRIDGQPIMETSEKVSIVIHNTKCSTLNSSLQEKFKSLKEAVDKKEPATTPRIQKVPFTMRDNKDFEKYYEPRVVSIGPIHHRNPKLKYAEKLKLRLAGHFIQENGLGEEDVFIKIKNDLETLKKCYDQDVVNSYSDDDLAWIFLLDGCAMLHFILCVAANNEGEIKLKQLKVKNDQVAFAQRDMFLLENQLPYKLLELLICSMLSYQKKIIIHDSIAAFIRLMSPGMSAGTPQDREREPLHLLDLLRESLIFDVPRRGQNGLISRFLLSIRRCWQSKDGKTMGRYSFRSVSELQASGIQLKLSGTSSFKDILFDQGCFIGTLKLPPIMVDDSTAAKFLNLIAYEMCPDFMNDFEVTTYICFLDSLIDHPDDVKALRKAGILDNILGSDEEVAKLFNEIGTDLVANQELYSPVTKKIEDHYKSIVTTWAAQGLHDHFGSPWSFLAFLGAMLALALSFIQAWYSMHPAKG